MVVFGASVSGGGTNSKAPMSQAAPCGRLTPRWSVAGGGHSTAASIAALPGSKAWVCVGPPLSASGPSRGSAESAKPQSLPGHSRLPPSSVTGRPAQFPPSLLATIVLLSVAVLPFPMPPPLLLALLPEMVELFTVRVPALAFPMPPLSVPALLPEMVELFTVRVPTLCMPPLKVPALLPEMVELFTSRVPTLCMPPLKVPALLPEMVELFTSRVPRLSMPPPALSALPLATVRLFRVSFAPLIVDVPTSNTRTVLLPLTVMLALPPSMISPAGSVMAGNCPEVRVMVAGETRLKLILSSPTPTAQSAEPDWLFWLALMMASRNEH